MGKEYICECGKRFDRPNSFNAHKSNCKIHFESLHKDIKEVYKKRGNSLSNTMKQKHKLQKMEELEQWIKEKHECEHCGKIMTEKFGSGRFCSRACANSREHSSYTKYKISQSMSKSKIDFNQYLNTALIEEESKTEVCPICGYRTSVHGMHSHLTRCKRRHNLPVYAKVGNTELNITEEELCSYIKSHTYCEICGKSIEESVKYSGKFAPKRLCIDHDHSTNIFRGLLCQACNRQLGWYEHNKENINRYLNK